MSKDALKRAFEAGWQRRSAGEMIMAKSFETWFQDQISSLTGPLPGDYGTPEYAECQRCYGPMILENNNYICRTCHTDPDKKRLPDLIVTRGDGVPLPDQAAAIEAFKDQCRSAHTADINAFRKAQAEKKRIDSKE